MDTQPVWQIPGMAPFRKVLVVQHASSEPIGTIGSALDEARIAVDTVRIDQEEAVPAVADGFDGLIIMGGAMGVYEANRYPFLSQELRLLERALARDLPILGVCLGSQLLAAALGARVFPSGRQEIGWYPITLSEDATRDPLFAGLPRTFDAFHWHGDTFDLPAGAVRLASSAITVEQGFRYGSLAYGLQFHLEVTAAVVDAMLEGADAQLAAARTTSDVIRSGTRELSAGLEAHARTVFGRWIRLVGARP